MRDKINKVLVVVVVIIYRVLIGYAVACGDAAVLQLHLLLHEEF